MRKDVKAIDVARQYGAVTTSTATVGRATRRQSERIAKEIRLNGLREGWTITEVVDRITVALPEVLPLEIHRWAYGWDRAELSMRIDLAYKADGLRGPGLSDTEICRWEHGQRRPSEERIDYLCRVYGTRPDRLGYGRDYSGAMVGHLEHAGLVDLFPLTGVESKADLISRIRGAREQISMFGLTRNFYGSDEMLPLFIAKARELPVRVYIMDPHCDSRRDRYRLEPAEAAMEDPARYEREVLRPLAEAVAAAGVDLKIYLYNFPCSFAMERTDSTIRVMLYGHGKRGTDGPIMTWQPGTDYFDYFASQLDWVARLAEAEVTPEPWRSKDVKVWEYKLG